MKKTLIGLMIAVMTLSGCSFNGGTEERETINDLSGSTANQPVEKRVVKIGVIAPLSGPGADYGEDTIYAIKTTVDSYNNDDSKKYKIDLIVEDGKCDGKEATNAIQKLINIDKVGMVIGGICSNETVAIGRIAQKNKVILFSPTSASTVISEFGDYVFRMQTMEDITNKISNYINKKNYSSFLIVYENSDYSADYVNKLIDGLSGNVKKIIFDSAEKDYPMLIKQIEKEVSSGIIIIPKSVGSLEPFLKEFINAGLTNKYINNLYFDYQILGGDIFKRFSGDVSSATFANVSPMKYITGSLGYGYIDNISYKIKATELNFIFSKETIDLILNGIDAGNTNSDQIKSYLESINENNQRDGMFGKYYFDQNGDAVGIPYVIQQIQSGQVVVIE